MTESIINASSDAINEMINAIRNQFCISIGSTSRGSRCRTPRVTSRPTAMWAAAVSAISTKPSRRPT